MMKKWPMIRGYVVVAAKGLNGLYQAEKKKDRKRHL